jgi:hypothetical protein
MKPIYNFPHSILTWVEDTPVFLGSRDTFDFYLAEYTFPFIIRVWAENQYSTLSLSFDYIDPNYKYFINKGKRLLLLK